MSPSQQINGVGPLPLRIDKGSHAIHKSSSSSPAITAAGATASHPRQRCPPVIIYSHSPKVIHTELRYFKALVQKLTGCPRSTDDDPASAPSLPPPPPPPPPSNATTKRKDNDDDDNSNSYDAASSAVSDVSSSSSEICSDVPPVAFEQQLPPPNRFSPGIPPFTPDSSDLFSSSKLLFSPSVSNMAGGGLSPSVFEALRTFLEE